MKPKLAAAIETIQQGAAKSIITSNLNGGTTITRRENFLANHPERVSV